MTSTLTNLLKGTTRLNVRADGWYYPDSLSAHEAGSGPTVKLALVGTGTITGIVEEHPDPRYKDRTWNVKIQQEGHTGVGSWGGSCNCNPDRTFTFENVPSGVYSLVTNTPSGNDSKPATPSTVTVKPGETTTVTLTP